MDGTDWKPLVWRQFGAAIDTLKNAIEACPEELWGDRSRNPQYWYTAFHTLFWLDYYLSDSTGDFAPPPPFGMEEMDPAGVLPDRVYTKDELLAYAAHGRNKCRAAIEGLTEERARRIIKLSRVEVAFPELLLYTLRHVQHHAAQLNLMLRQFEDKGSPWIFRAVE